MHDPLSRVPIKYKLTGAFVGICIIAFGFGGYLISSSAGSTLEEEITARLETQSAIISTRLEHQLELLGRRAEDFASDGFIRTHIERLYQQSLRKSERERLRERLRMHLTGNKLPLVPMVSNLSVIGREGRVVSSVHSAWYLKHSTLLQRGIERDTLWGSGMISESNGEGPVFGIFTPLWDIKRESRIGALVFWIHVEDWLRTSDMLQALGPSSTNGVEVILRGPGNRSFKVLADGGKITGIEAKSTVKEQRERIGTVPFQHKSLYAFDHHIAHWGWGVHVGMDATKAMASVSALQSRFLGAGIVVAVAAMILLFFPVQFLIRPLDRMRDAARAMMEGDYSVRVDQQTDDEIGELADSFNNMAAATQERTAALKKTARLLEKRSTELRMERDLLTTVIHSMEDGLIYLDAEGKVALYNQKAEPLASQLCSVNADVEPYICLTDGKCNKSCSDCLTTMDFERPHCTVECGDAVYEVLSAKVATGGTRHGRILVARDITGRERISERQAHQDRLAVLGEVAARMAHELNNPLAAASMFAQIMQKDGGSDFPFYEHVDVIMRNIDTCKRTIQDLLNYSRSGQPELADIDLQECVTEVVRFLRPLYEKKDIAFDLEFRFQNTMIQNDETYLRQVLMNVLMNALQALEMQGSQVTIRGAEEYDGTITLDIIDDGPGIAPKMQDKIFEPFVTSKPAGKGTGLGLSISRMIMRSFHGDLRLVSSSEGCTVFRLVIPRVLDRKNERLVEERI